MMPYPSLRPGAVVQISPAYPGNGAGCFAILDAHEPGGILARVPIPDHPLGGLAASIVVWLAWDEIEYIGVSNWMPQGVATLRDATHGKSTHEH
jgi:hypothetical protein